MYDVIIIGGGPGGYVAAERAGSQGLKVLLVEKENLGGVCLNHGCVPIKSLLNSAKLYKGAKSSASFGVEIESAVFNFGTAMKWKDKVVAAMVGGIGFLMKESGVEVLKGRAELLPGRKVKVENSIFEGKAVIIATGSSPFLPPVPGIESQAVITSRELLHLKSLPDTLTIIGGGVIGMEFASFFSTVGTRVTVVEMLPEVLPMMDPEMAKIIRREMKDVDFYLDSRVKRIDGNTVFFEKNGKEAGIESDYILTAVGRRGNIEGLSKSGTALEGSFVIVDERMRTNIPGVYAIGDITGKSMLAHSASRMGEVAVADITGREDRMRYNAIPWALYTFPEASGCGLTEKEARERGFKIKAGTYQMRNNSRFYAEHGKSPGVCKVVADEETGIILGIHLVGGLSSELAAGAATIIEAELRISEVKEIVYPHPSLSEVIRDAVWQTG